jgi:hypothetical protein
MDWLNQLGIIGVLNVNECIDEFLEDPFKTTLVLQSSTGRFATGNTPTTKALAVGVLKK